MGICVITVDLECCRCKAKIAKVLECLKEKVEFEEKNNKVVVRGKYDAEKLSQAVWCKAGKNVVKEIVIVDVWPPPKEEKPKPPEKKCDCHHCKHACCKVVCSSCCCDHCKPKPEKKKEDKPKPPAPKVEYKLVPYPYMWQYPCPNWPYQCPPHQQCQSCQQKPPAPPPPPPPSQPQPCACSSHGCGGVPPGWPPHMPPVWPPPWASTCNVDENQCSVM